MSKSLGPFVLSSRWLSSLTISLGVLLCAGGLCGAADPDTSSAAAPTPDGSKTNEVRQAIHEKGQAAVGKAEELWQAIDEKRLKNRTPDELVAWVIMGCLVGGLLFRFGKRGQLTSIVLGLVGSFIGGIVAHVAQLNFGLGPVLITYEDLICTLAGGLLMLCGARWAVVKKLFKPA
ncbi:MAG TPA: hypothetical protein VL361_29785 [Candidatus Limnocylindrales bacterium]|jgi:uncharacterized membrane protein YeaQ/YmgE (transglycosylase-associated protein family)|nr:hypothetical protein [Candidatus Limnocylindrales bacterium]